MHAKHNESEKMQTLAMYGGVPIFPEGPPGWPTADPDVGDVLRVAWSDGSWGSYHGVWAERLIDNLSEMHEREFVLLCSSGTYAVEAALRGVGVGKNDEVILAGYDFPGNFRAIEQVGARPVIVDIAADNWSIDPELLDDVYSADVRAVILSHLHGTLAPVESIEQWARSRNIALIEDACQVPGSRIGDRRVGSFGDVSVLSFGGSKLLTAGRGGALLTSREDIYQRAKIFGHRGNDAFPLSQLQAAVLLPQLDVLDKWNHRRSKAVNSLLAHEKKWTSLQAPSDSPHGEPSYYKLGWRYQGNAEEGPSRDLFLRALQAEGLAIDSGFRGFVSRSTRRCRRPVPLPFSENAVDSTVLLHHPILLAEDKILLRIVEALDKVHAALFA